MTTVSPPAWVGALLYGLVLPLIAGGCASWRKPPVDPFAQQAAKDRAAENAAQQAAQAAVARQRGQTLSRDTAVQPAAYNENSDSQVISSEIRPPEAEGWERFNAQNLGKTFKKAMGRGPDFKVAKPAYDEGLALFDQATELLKQNNASGAHAKFKEAAAKFAIAADRWPESALEEDALFMQAESCFFSDQYVAAEDKYQNLLEKFTNSRYLDKAVQRQFSIARFWQETSQANPVSEYMINVTDKSRPWFDTYGNAIRVYENIRLNDPRGVLADDAVMAAANAHFVNGKFDEADHLYGVLRTDYPKSEHQLNAHLLGLQCKLKLYQGPDYDIKSLLEADELAEQTLVNFPEETRDERDNLLRVRAEAIAQKALRDWNIAQKYEEGQYYRAARFYYQKILKDFAASPAAAKAQERLAAIEGLPDNPPDRFGFLDYVFGPPSGKAGQRPR
ncbi:MAG: outer membrane protein assembly factor BamD [Pirellulales bacterium]|nr:outer membrane protein assembly factor BamD [Pirellulales bacterium]